MRKYESEAVCTVCGAPYGDHAWKNDACPTKEQIARNIQGRGANPVFSRKHRFQPTNGGKT